MIPAGLLGAAALTIAGPGRRSLAVLFIQLQFLFDCCDGEVARWRGESSPVGVYLDRIAHHSPRRPSRLQSGCAPPAAGTRSAAGRPRAPRLRARPLPQGGDAPRPVRARAIRPARALARAGTAPAPPPPRPTSVLPGLRAGRGVDAGARRRGRRFARGRRSTEAGSRRRPRRRRRGRRRRAPRRVLSSGRLK